ncbi:MAG: hypothetical protein NC133_01920 [Prevotella sp.]|nr:hypothetical protein [Prevotella sp.]
MNDHLLLEKLTLHVKVDNENQIFSDFAYNEDNLSSELSNYLKEKAECAFPLPAKENFIIKIHSDNHHLRLPEITRCIHRHFHNEYDAAKRQLHHALRMALVLFGLGMIALILNYFAVTYVNNFFLTSILNITAWVFIWAAVEVAVLERHDIKRDCIILRRLAYAEVAFSNGTKLDAPVYI